jgi:hypothetical protein
MKKYSLQDLAKIDNLQLAWKRINTQTDKLIKTYQEDELSAFAWNLEKNLLLLSQEIQNSTYEPITPSRFYKPKANGLVRPFNVLAVKDSIVYQAIANICAKANEDALQRYSIKPKHIFGVVSLNKKAENFFLVDWKDEVKNFNKGVKNCFNQGFTYRGKYDSASYYDLLNHEVILEKYFSNFDDLFKKKAKECFMEFSGSKLSQGVPQGYPASGLFAQLYFYEIDQKIIRFCETHNIKYFRYVDDIELLATMESVPKVKELLVKIEIWSREVGLIPQSSKIIAEKSSLKKIIKGIENYSQSSFFMPLDAEQARWKIHNAINFKRKRFCSIKEGRESDFKFTLNRFVPSSSEDLELLLQVMEVTPHLVTEVCNSLERVALDHHSSKLTKIFREHTIYDFYKSQLLRCFKRLNNPEQSSILQLLYSPVNDSSVHWILKHRILNILYTQDKKENLFQCFNDSLKRVNSSQKELPFVIKIMRLSFQLSAERALKTIKRNLSSQLLQCDSYLLCLSKELQQMKYSEDNLQFSSPWYKNNFLDSPAQGVDGVIYHLEKLLNKNFPLHIKSISFDKYLSTDFYNESIQRLIEARGAYSNDPHTFFRVLDSFNHNLLIGLKNKENSFESVKIDELHNLIGKLKSLGGLGSVHTSFTDIHELRCKDPQTHAAQKDGMINSSSKDFKQRDKIYSRLFNCYEEFFEYIYKNHLGGTYE